MEFRARKPCERCKGRSMISSPDWADWFEKVRAAGVRPADAIRDPNYPQPEEPEEIDCPDCEGTGWVEFWMEIEKEAHDVWSVCAGRRG